MLQLEQKYLVLHAYYEKYFLHGDNTKHTGHGICYLQIENRLSSIATVFRFDMFELIKKCIDIVKLYTLARTDLLYM